MPRISPLFQKLAWTELVEIYYEHQAYDNPVSETGIKKEVSKKGIKIFKSNENDVIDAMEKLVGEDRVEEAERILNNFYNERRKFYKNKLNREIVE